MLSINEYNVPSKEFESSSTHIKFINFFKNEIEKFSNLKGIKNTDLYFSIVYDDSSGVNELRVRKNKQFELTHNDDLELSTLKANINLILQKNFPMGKLEGVYFSLILSFVENPYSKYPHYAKSAESTRQNEEKQTINILPCEPRYKMSQMILSETTENELKDVITLITLRKKIYEDWGFSEVDSIPRAIINFFGVPGTGKTMAAHALANQFNVKILCLNYADVESKYVGDAPKNLMSAFEIAKQHNALLFFDEADSFLGKRISNVSQGAEQAINSLRSQMLMLLEEFQGIVIFATNLIENYDHAFQSRILKHIKFELPTPELRLSLIKKMIPSKAPLEDEMFTEDNLKKLVELSEGFSGREIKNAVLNGITKSAEYSDFIVYSDIVKSFEEAKKSYEDIKGKNSNSSGIDKKKLTEKIKSELRKQKIFGRKKSRVKRISLLNN